MSRRTSPLVLLFLVVALIVVIYGRRQRPIAILVPVDAPEFRLVFDYPMSQEYHLGTNGRRVHKAIDLATPIGAPVISTVPGKVVRINPCIACQSAIRSCTSQHFRDVNLGYGWGKFVWVRHDFDTLPEAVQRKTRKTKYIYALYAHLDQIYVSEGDDISRDQIVGLTGNTGCSTGPHIHIEVRIGDLDNPSGRWQEQQALNPQELL